MKPTKLLQEIRKMRSEEAYEGWNAGCLTQAEAARILGVCERSFRRYMGRYEEERLDGLIDRQLEQASNRQAPADEAMALTNEYRRRYTGWNVKHFHSLYKTHGWHAQLHLGQKAFAGSGVGAEIQDFLFARLNADPVRRLPKRQSRLQASAGNHSDCKNIFFGLLTYFLETGHSSLA